MPERIANLLDGHVRFQQLRCELGAQVVQVQVLDVRGGANVAPSRAQLLARYNLAERVAEDVTVSRQRLTRGPGAPTLKDLGERRFNWDLTILAILRFGGDDHEVILVNVAPLKRA